MVADYDAVIDHQEKEVLGQSWVDKARTKLDNYMGYLTPFTYFKYLFFIFMEKLPPTLTLSSTMHCPIILFPVPRYFCDLLRV